MKEKRKNIAELQENEMVDDIFVVKFKKPVEQYKNGYRFELRVGDASKEIMVKYWGPSNEIAVQKLYDTIEKDAVVHVQGRAQVWNDQLEISTKTITTVPKGDYDASAFIKKSKKDIEAMWTKLRTLIESLQNGELKKIVEHFFADEAFAKKFKLSPAAMYIHHGWIGGLLEHTLGVCTIAVNYCTVHPELDRDLVITGCLFHDMGKLEEFETTTNIHMTTEGMLIGHVTIAVQKLTQAMKALNTPQELQWKVNHMVLTHMGEYGSSKTPAFPEALALYYADQADAQLTHILDIKANANTEDNYMYSKHFGNVYLK